MKVYQELAKTNPAYLGDLAGALNNLGVSYSELGRRQEALAPTEEAVKVYQELAKTNPAYLGDLALSLNNLGFFQFQQANHVPARKAFEESLVIVRPLAAANPAFLRVLQRTLNNLEEIKRVDNISLDPEDISYLPANDPAVRVKRAVVKLVPTFGGEKPGFGLGTGFVVKREGSRAWIATVLHVLRGEDNAEATKIVAELFTGPRPPRLNAPRLEVVLNTQGLTSNRNASNDEPILLEVLGLPPDIQPLPLATTPAMDVLTIIGHPRAPGDWSLLRYPLLTATQDALLLGGALEPGASGSPVLSASQQVVGIVYDSPEPNAKRPIPQTYAFPVKALADKMGR